MANWSELCPDILLLISKKLTKLSDFIHLRAVCRHWRWSAPISEHPRLLWLLFVPFPSAKIEQDGHLQFYSLSSKNTFTMSIAPNNPARSSAHQYVVIWHKESGTLQSLLNPVTKNKVVLPPTNLSWFDEIKVHGDSVMIYRDDPTEVSSCHLGDANWSSTRVTVPSDYPKMACCNGFIFCIVRSSHITKVLNADTGSCVFEIQPPVCESGFEGFDYLIESSGELLAVCRVGHVWMGQVWEKQFRFVVYKLHAGNDNIYNWVRMSNIGDRTLLLNKLGRTGLSVTGKDFGLKGSSVYFHYFQHNVHGRTMTILCQYDMKDDSVEEIASFFVPKSCTWSWFVPSLQ